MTAGFTCGTYTGYNRHRRTNTEVCAACRQAASDYNRQWRQNNTRPARPVVVPARPVPVTGVPDPQDFSHPDSDVRTGP